MQWLHVEQAKCPWWRHQVETFSALLAICAENSPVPCEFPAQRQVTRNFDVSFDVRPNKRLRKQSWSWWFGTLSRSLWRHRNEYLNQRPCQPTHAFVFRTQSQERLYRLLSKSALTHWGRDKMAASFPDDIIKCIFLNENSSISIKISLKFVPKGRINNIPALVKKITYLNQCWLFYWRIYVLLDLNKLTYVCYRRSYV